MDSKTIRQLRGANDLLQDAVESGARAIGEAHQAVARRPYALLEQICVVAAPARAIERAQQTVTAGVYQSIRTINRIAGSLAAQGLDWLEERESRVDTPPTDWCLLTTEHTESTEGSSLI
ncbi:MAG TPA: hypothetical protein VF897_22680 [Roseiflexaceae bacterium]